MSEHHFTDETATLLAVKQLAKDMRHVLSRITVGLTVMAFLFTLGALIDALRGDWFSAILSLAGAIMWWLMGYETWKRFRRYGVRP